MIQRSKMLDEPLSDETATAFQSDRFPSLQTPHTHSRHHIKKDSFLDIDIKMLEGNEDSEPTKAFVLKLLDQFQEFSCQHNAIGLRTLWCRTTKALRVVALVFIHGLSALRVAPARSLDGETEMVPDYPHSLEFVI